LTKKNIYYQFFFKDIMDSSPLNKFFIGENVTRFGGGMETHI